MSESDVWSNSRYLVSANARGATCHQRAASCTDLATHRCQKCQYPISVNDGGTTWTASCTGFSTHRRPVADIYQRCNFPPECRKLHRLFHANNITTRNFVPCGIHAIVLWHVVLSTMWFVACGIKYESRS